MSQEQCWWWGGVLQEDGQNSGARNWYLFVESLRRHETQDPSLRLSVSDGAFSWQADRSAGALAGDNSLETYSIINDIHQALQRGKTSIAITNTEPTSTLKSPSIVPNLIVSLAGGHKMLRVTFNSLIDTSLFTSRIIVSLTTLGRESRDKHANLMHARRDHSEMLSEIQRHLQHQKQRTNDVAAKMRRLLVSKRDHAQ